MLEPQAAENVNLSSEFVAPVLSPVTLGIWLPALLWTAMLCVFSTEPFGAAHTFHVISGTLHRMPLLLGFLDPQLMNVIARKGAHFSIYIGYFMVLATGPLRSRPWLAFMLCVLAGSCDEIHQIFVPGRTASIYDVGIDSCGALFGRFLYMAFLEA
jgi:VanZ family protein